MFEIIEKDGIVYLYSTLLKSKHGFSTRIGGVSELEHTKSLNLAFGRGDEREIVLENTKRFADVLSMDYKRIISVPQIHSSDVKIVSKKLAGEGVCTDATFSCDGYITEENDLPIGVKTADCVPILIEARNDGGEVIAVSAVHAGWRGTASRIVENAIVKLCDMGAKKENIFVVIGPCIDVCCYEVGNDFVDEIIKTLGQNYENKYIIQKGNGSYYANLKGMNLEILSECGILKSNIEVSKKCTCCDNKLFYSHRRQKGIRGSMLNLISK